MSPIRAVVGSFLLILLMLWSNQVKAASSLARTEGRNSYFKGMPLSGFARNSFTFDAILDLYNPSWLGLARFFTKQI